jgi:predicted kinase
MGAPALVVVTGPAGAGKTTLAHAMAVAIGCPAVCRDEIKEGMVHALDREYEAAPGDGPTQRASAVFFDVLRMLSEAGVSVVAEAAFQDHVWRPNLEPLAGRARIRVIRCTVDPAVGRRRMAGRVPRPAHTDDQVAADPRYYDDFVLVSLAVPTIDVDTSDGYDPPIDRIVAFAMDQ